MPSLALLAHLHIPSASFLLFAPPSSSLPWLKKNPSLSLFFFWPVSLSFTSLCLPRSPLAVPYLALPCLHFLLWHLLCLSGRLPLSGSPLSLCPPVSLPLSVSESFSSSCTRRLSVIPRHSLSFSISHMTGGWLGRDNTSHGLITQQR